MAEKAEEHKKNGGKDAVHEKDARKEPEKHHGHESEKKEPEKHHAHEAEREEPKKEEKQAPAQTVKVHPVKHAVHKTVHHVRHAATRVHAAVRRKPSEHKPHRNPHKKKTLGERWDDLTEGPFGTLIYIILGYLIAVAAIEVMKPMMATDTPVIAVFSESMLPTFEKGDMVFVQGGTEIKVGDIVVYDAPIYKYPIVHRVINVTTGGIATKGDHNAVADPWITPQTKVHGKAVLRVPYLGWVKVLAFEAFGIV